VVINLSNEGKALQEAVKRQKAFNDRLKKAKEARERKEEEEKSGNRE